MFDFDAYSIRDVSERLNQKEKDVLLKKCEEALGKPIETDIGFNLLKMTKEETAIVLGQIKRLNERNCGKKITDRKLNIDLMNIDDVEIE